MGSDNFCLRWNDFESNVSSSFRELREENDLFDVTLVTDSEKEFKAHKVILSACSSFFKGILRRMGSPSPLIYLRGIGSSDLAAILDFMYNGEVNVAQEELNSFLSVAEDLRIKGLTQKPASSENVSQGGEDGEMPRKMGSKSKLLSSQSSSGAPSSPSSSKKFRRIAPKSSEDGGGGGGVKELIDVKSEPTIASIAEASGADYDDGGDVSGSYDDAYADESAYFDETGMMGLDDMPHDASQDSSKDQYVRRLKNGAGGICLVCCKKFSKMGNALRHYEIRHSNFSQCLSCSVCGKKTKNQISLDQHMRINHGVYKREIVGSVQFPHNRP
nr:longitudinals lacking protein, isoforms H/M/V-like isoform X3 [Lepeophtheirus salmonis]